MDERIQITKFNKTKTKFMEFVVMMEDGNRSAIHVFTEVDNGKLDMERLVIKDMPRMTYNKIPHVRAIEKMLDMVESKLKEGYILI